MATFDRQIFTSRAKLYQHYAEHGYECTGGDHLTGKGVQDFKYPKTTREEVLKTAFEVRQRLKYGMEPLSEKERHECLKSKE